MGIQLDNIHGINLYISYFSYRPQAGGGVIELWLLLQVSKAEILGMSFPGQTTKERGYRCLILSAVLPSSIYCALTAR